MTVYYPAQGSSEYRRLTWNPPLKKGDSLVFFQIFHVTGTANVYDYGWDDNSAWFTIRQGTDRETAQFSAYGITANGEIIDENVFVPISALTNIGTTGEDIASFVLRKVVGLGQTPDVNMADDVLERVTDMLAYWASQGLDIGVPLPVTNSTVFGIDDAFVMAIKANAVLACVDLYGGEISPFVVEQAKRGLQLIKSRMWTLRDAKTDKVSFY
jgi:hypothetical protein